MAQKIWERFTPAEAKQLEKQNQELFSKYYDRYKERLQARARSFEKHGRTGSHGYKMIREQLDIQFETGKNAYNLSRMSQILNSKWSSYSSQRAIDKKIVKGLEENFGKGFINIKDLDAFGRMMDILRDSPMFMQRGSDPVAEVIGEGLASKAKTVSDWKELFRQKFGDSIFDSMKE